jgi:hypothetical protein
MWAEGIDLQARAKWLAKQAAEQELARERAHQAALRDAKAAIAKLTRAIDRGDVAAMRETAGIVQHLYGFRVEESSQISAAVTAYFNWGNKTATVPPITDAESFAVRLHEFGHGIAGDCTNREPHRRDPTVRDWWMCLACENAAWAAAAALVPFGRPMWARLHSSLGWYRQRTPADAAIRRSVDTLRDRAGLYGGLKTAAVAKRELRLTMAR